MSYIDDHPTNFNWRSDVQGVVNRVQKKWPWKTYINTYWWHPPYNPPAIVERFDSRSFDVWGGGGTGQGSYSGYRGKPLPVELGKQIFDFIFNNPNPPNINWTIYRGRMWWNPVTGGHGWQASPPGPADSDPGHYNHIHVTFL